MPKPVLTKGEILGAAKQIPHLSTEILEEFLLLWLYPTSPHIPVSLDVSYLEGREPGLKAVYQIGHQEVTLRIHGNDAEARDRWFSWQLTRKPNDASRIHAAIGSSCAEDAITMFNLWVQRFAVPT